MSKNDSPNYDTQESLDDRMTHLNGGATPGDLARLREREKVQSTAGTVASNTPSCRAEGPAQLEK